MAGVCVGGGQEEAAAAQEAFRWERRGPLFPVVGGKLGSAATECSRSYPPAATSLDGLAATGFSRGPEVKTMAWPAAVTCKVNANGRQGLIIMTWPVLKYWELVISDLLLVDIFLEEIFFERAPNT